MIGQFGINRCPILDNFGKKSGGVRRAVFGDWNDLLRLSGELKNLDPSPVPRRSDDCVMALRHQAQAG
jgi:hypothetical protein